MFERVLSKMRQDKRDSIREFGGLFHLWRKLDFLGYNKLNMEMKIVKKEKVPTAAQRQKIIAQNLEYNLYFNKRIKEFGKNQLSYDQLHNFRKDLRDKGIADLSAYWNDVINSKISFPDLKLSKMLESGVHISSVKIDDEYAHMIYVYPETTFRDLERALTTLQTRMSKIKVQPLGKTKRVYDLVYQGLSEEKSSKEIAEIIDQKIPFAVDYKTLGKISRRIKKGL